MVKSSRSSRTNMNSQPNDNDQISYVLNIPQSLRMANPILRYIQDTYNQSTDPSLAVMELVPYYNQDNILVVEQSTLKLIYDSNSSIDLNKIGSKSF